MILRKPLAFLIKNFKIIHAVLAALTVYLIFRTSEVMIFFNEYLGSNSATVDVGSANSLVNVFMFIDIFIIMLGTSLILTILKLKNKPIKFYIYNIVVCVFTLAVYLYAFTILERLEMGLVEVKTLELVRDLLVGSIIVQNVSLILLAVRATGFDIKSFNFNEDVEGIEITESDSEEFEIDLDVDKDKFKRRFRKVKRFLKYICVENKIVVNLFLLLTLSLVFTIIYLNSGVYEKVLQKNEAFQTTEFALEITDSYITKYDYNNKKLVDDTNLIVLRLRARVLGFKEKQLNMGRFALQVGKNLYYHTTDYKENLVDLGYTYNSEYIPDKFETYILVFEIPSNSDVSELMLKYSDTNRKEIKVNVTPYDLNTKEEGTESELAEQLIFTDSVLKNTTFKIETFAIADTFKVNYTYCATEKNCIDSYEYVKPTTADNYSKSLLKLVGEVKIDESLSMPPITTVYKFMTYFGKIKYTINGEEKDMNIEFKQVKPLKVKKDNEYYIEVLDELKNADSIKFEFNIRNRIYTYKLK